LCSPIDQTPNADCMAAAGINRSVYSQNLLRTMRQRVAYTLERFCDGDEQTNKFDYPRCMAATTIKEIDDAFIAPIYGFKDCYDYYRQTSSICVPTMILNARDDPFFHASVWPTEKSVDHGGTVPLKMVHTNHGGHLGFFLHQVDDDNSSDALLRDPNAPSWAATELGRFLGHVQERQKQRNII